MTGAKRDALMARIVWIAVPRSVFDLYDQQPSRDLWHAAHATFQENLSKTASGICAHYMHKCALDRVFSVRRIDPGTVSWWPTRCPSYIDAYKKLWPNRTLREDEHFDALALMQELRTRSACP